MNDPSFLLFAVRGLKLDVWHDEPGGHDAFEVCGHPPRGFRRLVWMIRHARHLHFRWWRYLNVKKWLVDRCVHCGQRFRWKEARFSYPGTDRVWHDPCMSLRHVRNDLNDLTGYVLGTADSDARWRANYRLQKQYYAARWRAEDRLQKQYYAAGWRGGARVVNERRPGSVPVEEA